MSKSIVTTAVGPAPLPEGSLRPSYRLDEIEYPSELEARGRFASGVWLNHTVSSALEQTALARPDAIAIVDDREKVTYRELNDRSVAVAQRLLSLGLDPGDRVLVQLGVTPTAVALLMGVFRAGLIPVCTVPQYRMFEMSALAERSDARAHVVELPTAGSTDLVALAKELRADRRHVRELIVVGEPRGGASGLTFVDTSCGTKSSEGAADSVQPSPLDVAAFQLSGGSTGVPKIIPRFHAEYLGYANAWSERLAIRPEDVILWSLPITHNAGMLCFLLPAILHGATLVLLSRFEVESFLATIERERVTVTGSIGPIAPRVLAYDHPSTFDLSTVRLFLTLQWAAQLEQHLAVPTQGIYGITEGLVTASRPGSARQARHETVGFPASPEDEVRILQPGQEVEVAAGAIGELCFRGPSVLRSYYRDPDATVAAFTTDGFFRTGDLVRAHDVDGVTHVSFEGRIKDNIDRGGEKFGVEWIELFLAEHPSILSAAVVGMPDAYLGERVCAFVIPTANAEPLSVEEVGRFLLERGLAKFKLPERIELVDQFPVTGVGKLDRAALRRRIAETLEQEERHRQAAAGE